MVLELFAVYDHKAQETIAAIQVAPTHGVAIRSFGDAVLQDELLKRHPEDYSLVFLGHWDSESGEIDPATNPIAVPIVNGQDISAAAASASSFGGR